MKLSLKINRTVRKAAALAVGLALGLFAVTAYARTPAEATAAVQAALNQLYPGQGWVAANAQDPNATVLCGKSGTSIMTHPSGSSSSNSPATLTRSVSITGTNPVLHLKVRCYSGGDWVLKVFVDGVQLDSDITVNSTTAKDYYFLLAAYVDKGAVTLQLQNAAGGAKAWYWEAAYWDLIEISTDNPPMGARWTGTANDGDPMNPENWVCTNAVGEVIASALPEDVTVVTIPDGCTNSFPTGKGFLAKEVKLPATLGANLDWSGITAPFSGTLDLQGKKLTVSQLAGNATIIDSTGLDYELLDSIKTTGTQYIETGMSVEKNAEFEMDFGQIPSDKMSNKAVLTTMSDTFGFYLQTGGNTTYFRFYEGSTKRAEWQDFNTGDAYTYKVHMNVDKDSAKKGGLTMTEFKNRVASNHLTTTVATNAEMSNQELTLFSRGAGKQMASCTFYRFWFKEASGAEHTFVPVRRISDGTCGILDLEAYQADPTTGFHGNANTAATSGDFTAGTVTNYLHAAGGIGTPGELHVNVAANTTKVNESVALSGNLKLMKEGTGAFTAAKAGQSYVGGTEVEAGLISLPVSDTDATGGLGLADSAIRVAEGATLDVNSNTGFKEYSVVLAGGMLRNGTVKSQDSADHQGTVGRITLEADSSENVLNNLTHTDLIDLNGHTLTVQIGGSGQYYILNENGSFTNGTVDITNGGWFRNEGGALDMRTVNMNIKAPTHLENNVKVNDLELLYASNDGTGDGRFLIYGTYKAGNYHRNCELQNGATLDLGGVTDAWPVESTFSTGTPLAFAKDATITVSLGGRKAKTGPIVTWQEGNAPDTSVNFALDPALNARLVRKLDGIWLQTGFLIRIR